MVWIYHNLFNNYPVNECLVFSSIFCYHKQWCNKYAYTYVFYMGTFLAVKYIPREGLLDHIVYTLRILITSAILLFKRREVTYSPTNSLYHHFSTYSPALDVIANNCLGVAMQCRWCYFFPMRWILSELFVLSRVYIIS